MKKRTPHRLTCTRYLSPAPSVAVLLSLLAACSDEPHTEPVAELSPEQTQPQLVDPAKAEKAAEAIETEANLSLAEGINGRLWASEALMGDPVAIDVDHQGRVWATVTRRRKTSELDIRAHWDWETASMAFQTLEDRRDFLHTELAPKHSDKNQWLEDFNEDGSRDWKDLTVMKEEVRLLQDTNDDGRANVAQTYLKDFHTEVTDVLGGVYYHNQLEELFLTVSPGAWRVEDRSGNGLADTKTALSEGFGVHIGFTGHGMSGMTLGPDGRLYYGIGDVGMNVTGPDGRKWAFPNQGVIVRSEVDGSHFEVFAAGLRNAHEFAFDDYGNLISVDNDGDHEGEHERIVYLIDGSDSGWRTHWQLGKYQDPKNNRYKVWMDEDYFRPHFEDQAAHVLPPIAPFHSGPAGMTVNPGTALGEEWDDFFFVAEFLGAPSGSGISGFRLEPDGASFKLAEERDLMKGILATGLDVGPDGALYSADWIEGWTLNQKGRLWRFDVNESRRHAKREETERLLGADFERRPINQLTSLLAHADRRVRLKAQFELVARQAVSPLQQVLTGDKPQLARIHAIWGLGQLAREKTSIARLLPPFLSDRDAEIRAQTAKVIGDTDYQNANDVLMARLQDPHPRVRFFAAQALGRLEEPRAHQPLVEMLEANGDEEIYLRHAGAIALARIGNETALATLTDHDSRAVRVAAVMALGRLKSPALADFLSDPDPFIVTNAARQIADDRFVEPALPALARLLADPPSLTAPLIRRAINANLYVGGQKAAHRLAEFAQSSEAKGALRAEALETLLTWPQSSPFDRVTGRHRGIVQYPVAEARNAVEPRYQALLTDEHPQVRKVTARGLGQLNVAQATDLLVPMLADDAQPSVREATLRSLAALDYPALKDAVTTAMRDRAQQVRAAGLDLLPSLSLSDRERVETYELLLRHGNRAEQQAALRSLGELDTPPARQLLGQKLEALRSGDLPAELHLDVLSAARASDSPELNQNVESYLAQLDPDSAITPYQAALNGGDAEKGRQLFTKHPSAQCVRCHTLGETGNSVGPDLARVGERLTRKRLLEAMVAPGARVSPGQGRLTLQLENQQTVSGQFKAETETAYTLVDGDEILQVDKSKVVKRSDSGSGMPSMADRLSTEELRDLVEFLTRLTGSEGSKEDTD